MCQMQNVYPTDIVTDWHCPPKSQNSERKKKQISFSFKNSTCGMLPKNNKKVPIKKEAQKQQKCPLKFTTVYHLIFKSGNKSSLFSI